MNDFTPFSCIQSENETCVCLEKLIIVFLRFLSRLQRCLFQILNFYINSRKYIKKFFTFYHFYFSSLQGLKLVNLNMFFFVFHFK